MTFTARPPSLITVPDELLKAEIDKWLLRIYQAHGTLDSTAVQAPATGTGYLFAHGRTSVTGSKLGIVTGLTTVTNCGASIDNGATATNFTVTARVSSSVLGGIDVYVWMPTAAGDTTPIAATSAVTVAWWAAGS